MRKDIMISGICALSLIMLTQNAYAQTYEKESESGKVRFQCELEVPENWNGKEIPKLILESVHFVDSEKTYANFVEGKEILEHYNTPANFTDICRTGKCMGTDIDDDFLHPVCDNIIPFSLLGRDVYLLIYVTSDVCLVDCDMAEKCEKQ